MTGLTDAAGAPFVNAFPGPRTGEKQQLAPRIRRDGENLSFFFQDHSRLRVEPLTRGA